MSSPSTTATILRETLDLQPSVHAELTQVLRRDIIGDLPRELAVLIFVKLDTQSLLACGGVSRAWQEAAGDQSLWHIRCADHDIHPHPSTAWRDVFIQRDRIQRQKAETDALQDLTRARQRQRLRGEGAGEGDVWDEEYERSLAVGNDESPNSRDTDASFPAGLASALQNAVFMGANSTTGGNLSLGGLRRDVQERPIAELGVIAAAESDLPTGAGSSTAARRPSFRTGRHQSGLPMFMLPGNNQSGTGNPDSSRIDQIVRQGPAHRPSASSTTLTSAVPPIASHNPEPFPKPLVNYKHLYLTHRIIKKRFISARQRPYILDSRTSCLSGGLEGHREGIYCLQILHEELSIPTTAPTQGVTPHSPTRRGVDFTAGGGGFNPSLAGTMPLARTTATIEGRNWIFSGSRDKTIRLWDLDTLRVVKIYQSDPASDQGHTNSVLTLHARTVSSHSSDGSISGPGLAGTASAKCVKMISGGSDGRLVIWDVLTGKILDQIQAHDRGESVLCVRFDEKRIVSCSKDRSIRTFDSKTLEPLLVLGGSNPNVGVLAENHHLDADIPGPYEIEGHRAAVNSIELVKDYIISVSGDRTLRVWSAETGDCLLIIDAHTRGIASLDIDVGTGTCVTGSSDWGIRRHELGEWGLDIGQGVGDDATEEGREGLTSWSSESSLGYPTIRRKRNAVRPSLTSTGVKTADSSITSSSPTAEIKTLDISPRQVAHPHGFEFRAGKGCCISTTRPRFAPAQPAFPADQTAQNTHARAGGYIGSASGTSTPGGGHACFNCEKKGHTDLVRSLWLGEDVVFSGSYDSKLKFYFTFVLQAWNRHTGLLIKDLPDLHTGRIFSVVGDKTKVISSGIDQRIVIWDFAYGLDTSFVDM
ncbi:hypothetical protein QFC21_001682 [Naganishia friedmannii]|uniref:Uncharacterized protein n=1 Tax=Naganishia friedmannii TaxID=89922 RepID=A0ACC2W258_9TREE|nr:hypothetical protein QFC21_001682 [Naganishia friedmannii]